MNNNIQDLVGKKILRVRMSEQYLIFETDKGILSFTVEGDCCSSSYFYDFFGVKKLLDNGPVISVKELKLQPSEFSIGSNEESVESYGYEIVTNHEHYGEQTSVFSFRNSSNGYYGGWMTDTEVDPSTVPEITKDVLISQY